MTRRAISPAALHPPFGRYSPGMLIEGVSDLLLLSGLLGIRPDGSIPESVEEQTAVILESIDASLREVGLARSDLLRLSTFITEADDRLPYMRLRDAWVADPPPASTLIVVKALALPAFKIEIEAIAGR